MRHERQVRDLTNHNARPSSYLFGVAVAYAIFRVGVWWSPHAPTVTTYRAVEVMK